MVLVSIGGNVSIPQVSRVPFTNRETLNAADEYIAFIMAVPKTGTLKKVCILTGTVTTADTINVSIETVDPATGYPSGTLYATGATGSQESPTSSTFYWIAINSTSGISVTAGDLIAIKVSLDYVDGDMTIQYNNWIHNPTNSEIFPYVERYVDSTHTKGVSEPCVALEYDGEIINSGSVCCKSSSVNYNNSSSGDYKALKITMPFGARIVGAWAYADIDNPAQLILYSSDGYTSLGTISFDPDIRVSTSAGIFISFFSSPITLIKNSSYRLALIATTSSNITFHYMTFGDDDTLKGIDQMPFGQNACYSYCTDAPDSLDDWSDISTYRPMMGLIIDKIDIGSSGSILQSPIVGGIP